MKSSKWMMKKLKDETEEIQELKMKMLEMNDFDSDEFRILDNEDNHKRKSNKNKIRNA
jgi:hypothetical protein